MSLDLILKFFENRANLTNEDKNTLRPHVNEVLKRLDNGSMRVANLTDSGWQVNEIAKKAILLSFALQDSKLMKGASSFENDEAFYFDKIDNKFANWDFDKFTAAKIRSVPGSYARFGSYIGENVVMMPCFVNIGAYVGAGTMIDAWSTIGSCAQIGERCHISGGVGIGGVLEPLQANPVIIEDHCFVGARSEIAEGVIVGTGSVIATGTFISASTKIYNRETGEIFQGRIPPYSVVVPGSLPSKNNCSLNAAIIIKTVDENVRAKTSINELLR